MQQACKKDATSPSSWSRRLRRRWIAKRRYRTVFREPRKIERSCEPNVGTNDLPQRLLRLRGIRRRQMHGRAPEALTARAKAEREARSALRTSVGKQGPTAAVARDSCSRRSP